MADPLALFGSVERAVLIRRAALATAVTWLVQLLTNVPLVLGETASWGSLSLQMARTLERAEEILGAWEAAGVSGWATVNLVLDFSFIASYATLLAALAVWAGDRIQSTGITWGRSLGLTVAWGQWIAGAGDVIENVALLSFLSGVRSQALITAAFLISVLKFLLLAVGIVWVTLGALLGLVRS